MTFLDKLKTGQTETNTPEAGGSFIDKLKSEQTNKGGSFLDKLKNETNGVPESASKTIDPSKPLTDFSKVSPAEAYGMIDQSILSQEEKDVLAKSKPGSLSDLGGKALRGSYDLLDTAAKAGVGAVASVAGRALGNEELTKQGDKQVGNGLNLLGYSLDMGRANADQFTQSVLTNTIGGLSHLADTALFGNDEYNKSWNKYLDSKRGQLNLDGKENQEILAKAEQAGLGDATELGGMVADPSNLIPLAPVGGGKVILKGLNAVTKGLGTAAKVTENVASHALVDAAVAATKKSGASIGASVGSLVGGPIGTVIGAAIGKFARPVFKMVGMEGAADSLFRVLNVPGMAQSTIKYTAKQAQKLANLATINGDSKGAQYLANIAMQTGQAAGINGAFSLAVDPSGAGLKDAMTMGAVVGGALAPVTAAFAGFESRWKPAKLDGATLDHLKNTYKDKASYLDAKRTLEKVKGIYGDSAEIEVARNAGQWDTLTGGAPAADGVHIVEGPNGKPRVVINGSTSRRMSDVIRHDVGHLLTNKLIDPKISGPIKAAVMKNFSPDELNRFAKIYDAVLIANMKKSGGNMENVALLSDWQTNPVSLQKLIGEVVSEQAAMLGEGAFTAESYAGKLGRKMGAKGVKDTGFKGFESEGDTAIRPDANVQAFIKDNFNLKEQTFKGSNKENPKANTPNSEAPKSPNDPKVPMPEEPVSNTGATTKPVEPKDAPVESKSNEVPVEGKAEVIPEKTVYETGSTEATMQELGYTDEQIKKTAPLKRKLIADGEIPVGEDSTIYAQDELNTLVGEGLKHVAEDINKFDENGAKPKPALARQKDGKWYAKGVEVPEDFIIQGADGKYRTFDDPKTLKTYSDVMGNEAAMATMVGRATGQYPDNFADMVRNGKAGVFKKNVSDISNKYYHSKPASRSREKMVEDHGKLFGANEAIPENDVDLHNKLAQQYTVPEAPVEPSVKQGDAYVPELDVNDPEFMNFSPEVAGRG